MAWFALAAAVVCLYSASFGHNFLFDEDDIILTNPLLRDLSRAWRLFGTGFFQTAPGIDTIWEQYYRPLTSLTFAFDYRLWGVNPMGYNLTNAFLHAAVAGLLFMLLRRMFGGRSLPAFLAALLWAAHTIHTEAVTYIASRGDLLGGAGILGALLLYWKRLDFAALAVYLFALFTKESVLITPAYLLVLDIAFLRSSPRALARRLWPFAAVAISYVIFRKTVAPVPFGPPDFRWDEAALRLFSMGPAFLSYCRALIAPEPFKFCEPVYFAVRWSDPQVRDTLAVAFSLTVLWVLTWKRRGAVFFGATLFLVSLGPTLQIVHMYPEWAEHYWYVPSMGLTVLVAAFADRAFAVLGSRPLLTWAFIAIYAPFLVFVGYRTVQRNGFYANTERYYEALSRSESPYAYYGHINLGLLAVMRGSWGEAFVPLRTAYLIHPLAESNNFNMGLYHFVKHDYERAYRYFLTAYETPIGRHLPNNLMNAAQCLVRLGRYDEAIPEFEKVLAKLPASPFVYKNLVRAHLYAGRPERAREWALRGLEAMPKGTNEHAAMRMENAVLGFLVDDRPFTNAQLDALAQENAASRWYGDVARFLTGKMSDDEFDQLVRERYPQYIRDARHHFLMGYLLRGDWTAASAYLEANREAIEAEAGDPPFARRMIARARDALAEHRL